jgi:hypothetical protein
MVACPHDLHWCDLSACRAEGCKMNGEPPFSPCADCGVLVVRTARLGICVDCLTVEVLPTKET